MYVLLLIFVTCLICVLIVYTVFKNDLLNPVVLFCAPLIINVLLYIFMYSREYQISTMTIITFILGILCFLLGYFLFESNQNGKIIGNNYFYCDSVIIKVYAVVGIVGFIFGMIQLFQVGNSGPSSNFFINVRYYEVFGERKNILVKYAPVFLHVVASTECYKFFSNKKSKHSLANRFQLFFLIALLLLSTLITMARTAILQYIVSISYIFFYCNNNNKKYLKKMIKISVILVLLMIAVFTMYALISGRGKLNIFSSEFFVYKYLGYSLVAFDKYIVSNPSISEGYYVLGPLGVVMQKIGFIDMEYVVSILATTQDFNVYSYLSGPYLDFGIVGVIITMFILGIGISLLYNFSLNKGGYWMLFYATYTYSLVISFFAYQFSNTYSIYLILLFFILSRFRVPTRCLHRRGRVSV